MSDDQKTPDEEVNGAACAAKILNALPADTRQRLLSAIATVEPGTFAQIKANFVTFDDIPTIADAGIQVLLREVAHEDIVLAVAHGHIRVKEVLLRNMSERKARAVLQDAMYALKSEPEDVKAMERRVARKIDELRKAGVIRTQAEDDVWV